MLKIYDKVGRPELKLTQRVLDKAKKIYKGEQQAYESAYLMQVRQALNPYL